MTNAALPAKPWITIIGIGDDGLDGLPEKTRALISHGDLLVGGERHQAMVADFAGDRLTWAGGLDAAMTTMENWRGKNVIVLATGDPMCFGAGTTLQRRFDADEIDVIPHVSAFSLAAAKMKWSLPDCDTLTLHGRPVENIQRFIHPGARLIALSWDGTTPGKVAGILSARGFGDSTISVFEHMGGPTEKAILAKAQDWVVQDVAMLNTICVDCQASKHALVQPLTPGLPEDAYDHDRLITKREVRAVTLARLMPGPDQLLWDVGAGAGSVAIEWMRAARGASAIAIEKNQKRRAMAAANAHTLGVPGLKIIDGLAPDCFNDDAFQETPDAIFIGGGVSVPGLIDSAMGHLKQGGRLVANAVTVEAEAQLLALFKKYPGSELCRLSVSRADAVGRDTGLTGFKPMMTVTQFSYTLTDNKI